MIQITGPQLTQWDVGRSVSISDSNATHVHFANQGDSKAPIIEITEGTAKIPDYLLQTGKTLLVYAVLDGVTLESKSFAVRKRERPENYVYEDDQRNYIYELITDALTASAAANQAAENASNAATNAETAATSATEAAESANLATKGANEAAHIAKSFMVIGETAGTNISLDDAIKQFFVGLRIFGKTTQDGTPSPEAPVELVSVGAADGEIGLYVAGRNLFANSETHAVDATGAEVNNSAARRTPYIPVKPGQKIAFSKSVALPADSEPNGMLRMFDNNRQYVSSTTALGYAATKNVVTIPDGIYFVRFVQYGFTYVENLKVQMEFAEAATEYDGTMGQSLAISTPTGLLGIPVTSGGNYTDSDGQQWICDEIDLDRGVHIQRIARIDLSTLSTWARGTGNGWANASAFYSTSAVPEAVSIAGYDTKANILCNRLTVATPGNIAGKTVNSVGQGTGTSVYVSIEGIEAAADLITYLAENETVVQYVLAEPIETALTEAEIATYAELHTNKPNTTIYNDAGAYMDLEYVMDAKKYIDKLAGSGGSSGGGAAPARLAYVTLLASAWTGADSLYSQVVTIDGVTEYSKVDLLPSVEQLAIFHNKDVAFVTENENGVVTVYAIGEKPTNNYTMQVSITEVVA